MRASLNPQRNDLANAIYPELRYPTGHGHGRSDAWRHERSTHVATREMVFLAAERACTLALRLTDPSRRRAGVAIACENGRAAALGLRFAHVRGGQRVSARCPDRATACRACKSYGRALGQAVLLPGEFGSRAFRRGSSRARTSLSAVMQKSPPTVIEKFPPLPLRRERECRLPG
jgi:hypothetical protein